MVQELATDGVHFALTLPDLDDISLEQLKSVIAVGNIIELNLGITGTVELGDIVNAIDGSNIRRIRTPKLYARPFYHESRMVLMIRASGPQRHKWCNVLSSLPRPKQFPVTQLVYARHTVMQNDLLRPGNNGLERFNVAEAERQSDSFSDYDPPTIVVPFALKDSFTSPMLLVPALPRLLTQVVCKEMNWITAGVTAAALGIARQWSTNLISAVIILRCNVLTLLQSDLTMNPAPGELVSWAETASNMGSRMGAMPASALRQGEWTVVICHELPMDGGYSGAPCLERVRYAFATLDSEGKTRVLDVASFLRETAMEYEAESVPAVLAKWEEGVDKMKGLRFETRSQFLAFLKARYPERATAEQLDEAKIDCPEPQFASGTAKEVDEVLRFLWQTRRGETVERDDELCSLIRER